MQRRAAAGSGVSPMVLVCKRGLVAVLSRIGDLVAGFGTHIVPCNKPDTARGIKH